MQAPDASPVPPSPLAEALTLSRQLRAVLEAEHSALTHNDVAQLEQITPQKLSLAERLAPLIATLAASAPHAGSLDASPPWQQLSELTRSCQRRNDENAALLHERQQQIRRSLQPLVQTATDFTYGQELDAPLPSGGRTLGRA